jgi:hypothetical protein
MKFFKIVLLELESPEFTSSSSEQIGTWLYLHALCSKEMNGGMIESAENHLGKYWSRHGIELETLKTACPLWEWRDGNLFVRFFDYEGQESYRKMSKGGKDGANARWEKGRSKGMDSPPITPPNSPPNGEADTYYIRSNEMKQDEMKRDEKRSPSVNSAPLWEEEEDEESARIDEIFSLWKEFKDLPGITKVNQKRKDAAKARLRDPFFRENWKEALAMLRASPFCMGTNKKGWKADIDWFLKEDIVVHLIEGKYDQPRGYEDEDGDDIL